MSTILTTDASSSTGAALVSLFAMQVAARIHRAICRDRQGFASSWLLALLQRFSCLALKMDSKPGCG